MPGGLLVGAFLLTLPCFCPCNEIPGEQEQLPSSLVGSLDLGLSTKSFPFSQVGLKCVILCDSACSTNVMKSHETAKFRRIEEWGNPSSFHKPGAPAFPTSRQLRDAVCTGGHSEVRSYKKKKRLWAARKASNHFWGAGEDHTLCPNPLPHPVVPAVGQEGICGAAGA